MAPLFFFQWNKEVLDEVVCQELDFNALSVVQGRFGMIKLLHKQMHISKLFSYMTMSKGEHRTASCKQKAM